MANKIVQLQNKDGDDIFPISAGLASDSVTTDMIQDGAVTSAKIADGTIATGDIANAAVTGEKIDFSTLKPRWKVVSTSTTNTVTIPKGYRMYRLNFTGYKNRDIDWGVFYCSRKTGDGWVYGQGVANGGWGNREIYMGGSEKTVNIGATIAIAAGKQVTQMYMNRDTKTSAEFYCTYTNSYSGSLSYLTGRSQFTITSPTTDFTLQSECNTNFWVVEALDE